MLRLEHVYKRLGNFQLKDINLEIKNEEYFIILGPTGTGKTVILEVIAGMYHPDQGEIWFNGKSLKSLYPEQRKIGFVYQDYALFPHLSVKENIVFGLRIRKIPEREIKKQLDDITALLGIEYILDRYSYTLSGGEQQRASIARALIASPSILLLDEPLSALDPLTKEMFQQELKRIHQALKTTTIHITHDFTEALYLADKIGIMHDGKIVQVGTPVQVFRQPQSVFVANFLGIQNIFTGELNDYNLTLASGINMYVVTNKKRGTVKAAIRPEDIIISKEPFASSARNKFKGKITNTINQGPLYKVTVDVGISLISKVTTKSIEDMNLGLGDVVWVTFKSTAVHVF